MMIEPMMLDIIPAEHMPVESAEDTTTRDATMNSYMAQTHQMPGEPPMDVDLSLYPGLMKRFMNIRWKI